MDFVLLQRGEFQTRLDSALNSALVGCAASVGIALPQSELSGKSASIGNSYLILGLTDADLARSMGYVVADGENEDAAGDPLAALPESQRSIVYEHYFGTGASQAIHNATGRDGSTIASMTLGDGCLRQAYIDFFGNEDTFFKWFDLDALLQDASSRAREAFLVFPLFTQAFARWSTCMTDQGLRVDDLSSPFDLYLRGWPEPRPSSDEINTAVADVQCKNESGYVADARNALETVQQQILESEGLSEALVQYRDIIDTAGI